MKSSATKIYYQLPLVKLLLLFNAIFISLGVLNGVQSAMADGPALDVGDPHGGSVFRQGTYSLGWRFTANGPLVVTALGIFDDEKNGLLGSHEVGIFDADDCNLLRRVTVAPGDGRIGYFVYHQIQALALVGSKSYYIAAVTNDDNYLYNPTTVTTDGLISFGGFAIFGNTQTTSELKCPNGPASSPGIKGDFGPNFYIGALPSIISDPASGNDPTKRDTALTVFCNRNGSNLGTATCTATLADKGTAPRFLPTGSIDWVATDGFVPNTATCNPTQTSFSPGIGSCEAQFTVPEGFSIGTKFPISVSYAGDSNFNGSSAGHKLITPKCVSTDPNKPCPNSIGLTFSGPPLIVKDKIKAIVQCGGSSNTQSAFTLRVNARDIVSGGTCHISGLGSGLIADILKNLSFEEIKAVGSVVTEQEAKNDTLMYYLKNSYQIENEERWKIIQETQEAIMKIQEDVIKNRISVRKDKDPWAEFIRSPLVIRRVSNNAKPKFDKAIKSSLVEVDIKPNKQKNISLKMPKRISKLIGFYKKAGIATIPLSITISGKQDKRKGKASVTESVEFVIK